MADEVGYAVMCYGDNEQYELDFEGDDTIGDIKKAIEKKSNINPKYIRLFYHGEEEILFSDDASLFDVFGTEHSPLDSGEDSDEDPDEIKIGVDFTTDPAALRKVTKRVDCTILEVNHTKATIKSDPLNIEATIDLKKVSAFGSLMKMYVVHPESNFGPDRLIAFEYHLSGKIGFEIKTDVNNESEWSIFSMDDSGTPTSMRAGRICEFRKQDHEYKMWLEGPILPLPFPHGVENLPWGSNTKLEMAWRLSKAAYYDGEEQENCLGNLGSTFSEKETLNLDGHSQKCLIAYDQEYKTLCIAFRGSKVFDDWMVNFKIKLIQPLDFDNCQLKTHTGFHNLAMQWKAKLLERICQKYKPERIITTGHSLGGATSAMVHILLVNHFRSIEYPPIDIQNLTFAAPLFGNLELRHFLSTHEDQSLNKMFHFVNVDDIIPASMLVPYVYNSQPWYARWGASLASSFDWSTYKGMKKVLTAAGAPAETEQQKNELKEVCKELVPEAMARTNEKHLLHDVQPEICMPIGNHYFLVGNQDSAAIHKVNSTDDHQWIGQILLSSLAYKGEMKVKERHSIENYGKQIKGLNLTNINLMPSDLERRPE